MRDSVELLALLWASGPLIKKIIIIKILIKIREKNDKLLVRKKNVDRTDEVQ